MTDVTIDNQQPSLSDFDLGWLCGIIDGEGTIGLWSRGGNRKDNVKAGLRLASTDKNTIEKFCSILSSLGVTYYITTYKGNKLKNMRNHWSVAIEGYKRILQILPVVKDHLVCKKEQAELVYDFAKRRFNKWHRAPYDEYELVLINIAKEMNRTGYREEGSTTILNGVGSKQSRSAQLNES